RTRSRSDYILLASANTSSATINISVQAWIELFRDHEDVVVAVAERVLLRDLGEAAGSGSFAFDGDPLGQLGSAAVRGRRLRERSILDPGRTDRRYDAPVAPRHPLCPIWTPGARGRAGFDNGLLARGHRAPGLGFRRARERDR